MGSREGTDTAHGMRLSVELRRGAVALAVLAALRTPSYGYALQQRLVDRGFDIEQGTLYPLLRRLDEQGFLDSDWTLDGARPRKYYRLSAEGARVLDELAGHWERLVTVLADLLGDGGEHTVAAATAAERRGKGDKS